MNGGKIAVCICKGRVYLDGACVTLQSSLNVLHLFQGVAHVGIGISKGRAYSVGENKTRIKHLKLFILYTTNVGQNFKNSLTIAIRVWFFVSFTQLFIC